MNQLLRYEQLLPDFYRFDDTCNMYVICDGDQSLAIDFGSGAWLKTARDLGLPPVRHVFLTHHHADQCQGLLTHRTGEMVIHAPMNDEPNLCPDGVAEYWQTCREMGCPRSYSVLPQGLDDVNYHMGFMGDWFCGTRRVRFVNTPGHGENAVSVLLDHHGKQLMFCGDAAHVGATIWEPYHLEWDHWTASGALAAWEGIKRLEAIGMDMLCPSHGPVISEKPNSMLSELAGKLLRWVDAKGSICPGERDDYLIPLSVTEDVRHVLPSVYQVGQNGYLLLSENGQAMGIDFQDTELQELHAVIEQLGCELTTVYASHYHFDHTSGLLPLRERYGAKIVLHSSVAYPMTNPKAFNTPWQSRKPITADVLLDDGHWQWNEYAFEVFHYPGQTWWHCGMVGEIDQTRCLFGGDSFQPNSRWNGTGGFCAYNGCRFDEGFAFSAKRALAAAPQVVLNGHQTFHRFRPSQYHKIIQWSDKAREATRALCPNGDLETDYYRSLGPTPWGLDAMCQHDEPLREDHSTAVLK